MRANASWNSEEPPKEERLPAVHDMRRGLNRRVSAPRPRLAARAFVAACLLLPLLAPLFPAQAIVSTPITIDGDLSDWTGVRADPQNAAYDTQISDPDPDYPGQPDRDVYLVNATWDTEFLYLAYRRTSGGTKAIVFGAYIDLNGDGLLQSTDVVCSWQVNQSGAGRFADAHASSPSAHIFNYNQAIIGKNGPYLHPGGDPMGDDGETPDGWADVQSGQILPVQPMDGWMATNGIEFEGRVAWSDLGVPAGSPIAIHFVNGNGESFGVKWVPSNTRKWTGQPPQYVEENRGQVEDNVDDIWWLLLRGVSVSPDNVSGGEAGQSLIYNHTVTNSSNTTDTFDLSSVSDRPWGQQITDTGGAALSSVTLAPGASAAVQVRLTIPGGTADGTRDVTTLTAISRADGTVRDSATDSTTCGRVTVTPDQSTTMAPGQTVSYTFTVTNNLPGTTTYDLTTLSSLGWTNQITDTGGTPITSVTLASGASTQVVVRADVPAGATIGSQDITRLTAARQGDGSIRASATGATTVAAGLTIVPNGAGFGGSNSAVTYPHTVTNSWPSTRTIALTATSSRGWTVKFYAADGVTEITSVTLGPNGASANVFVRVAIPDGTAENTVDVTTVQATTGATTATATDTTTVRLLATYADAGYVFPATVFDLTDTAFARATGLSAGSKVTFVWKNPSGTIVRTSPQRTVDTAGMAFDSYTSLLTDPTGDWIVELRDNSNALLETTPITFQWDADITALSATDAPGLGDTVAVTSSVRNNIARAITNSTLTYVMWWDTDGSGSFNAGDTYIDSAGAPHVWDGIAVVTSHVTAGVNVPASGTWTEAIPWTVTNHLFPNQGTYRVTETWREAGGLLIDTKTTLFYSIPAMGWPLAALTALVGAWWLWRRRDRLTPAGPAVTA